MGALCRKHYALCQAPHAPYWPFDFAAAMVASMVEAK